MKHKIYALALVGMATVLWSFTSKTDNKYFEISKNIEIFTNVYKELNTWYVDDLDPATVMRTGIDAMVAALDPYTVYYSESQIEGYRQTEGRYDALGAVVKLIDDYPTIVEPFENSPAVRAGLKAGDQIIAINGESAQGRSTEDVTSVVRGVPGTTVSLRIRRPGEKGEQDITLTRGEVAAPNVPYSGLVDKGIGYIALTTFTQNAGRNVSNALRDLKTDDPDLRGVVLDLRGNGGGLLREAVNVSNVFIDRGEEVVSTRGKVPERDQSYSTRQEPVDKTIPLVVLIDKNSASASEIVSGVIQDLDRGVLLGQRTYGKGLVQNTRDVGYNARLKMTTAKYYIPSGRCIQSVEYENGEPKDIADDRRAQFTTRNGRVVLDGGGVKPDLVIQEKPVPEVLTALQEQDLIFKYVTDYCLRHDDIGDVESFRFNEFDDFVKYVTRSGFTFQTSAEKALADLERGITEPALTSRLKGEVRQIRTAIDADKESHLERYRAEIVEAIEMDIVGRYYFQNGKTRQRLKNDPELREAISLLQDGKAYSTLLK
ncbi:MAG: S41 family peptidase [Saprospiraceae bacterium]|nr:S41 family peptidase [Saprospiraceae bacterium]